MFQRFVLPIALASFLLLPAGAAARSALLPSSSFEIFTPDSSGGGWVIHKIPIKGDLLWGCADVRRVDRCNPVPLPDFMPATSLDFIHIDDKTQAAWLKVTVPVLGDTLMACYDPEGSPRCEKITLEAAPPVLTIDRIWPAYDAGDSGGQHASAQGGILGGRGGTIVSTGPSKAARIEPSSKGSMWLSASIPVPGPVNLYACRNLATEPECQLSVPDVYQVMREDVGFKKVSSATNSKGRFVGVVIEDIVEGSAAARAKLRPGEVIVRVGGFPLKNTAHFKGLLTQWPATYEIPLELRGGREVNLKVRRPSRKKK
ncbi:MAG TPA: hypothetical protein DIU15_05270 [Deltaproteobacteria bacterium]|nr:hypothetical protein [Deltaproteobacteria bacterium]HCP45428.1 hypothetical protein [Deltaproteobacteria bacterium]